MKHSFDENNTIRVLAVAPYKGLKYYLEREVKNFPEIQLDIIVGDLEEGLRQVKENYQTHYDVILSRGGTARLLREHVSIPVFEVNVHLTDILHATQISENYFGKRALVGFPNITDRAKDLAALLQFDMEIITLSDALELKDVLKKLKKENYQTIICDVVTSTTAQAEGFDTILITSGTEAVRQAFQNIIRETSYFRALVEENHFLRMVLSKHSTETMIFREDGSVFFNSLEEQPTELLQLLKENLESALQEETTRIVRSIKGYLYTIKANVFLLGSSSYVVYYVSRSRTGISSVNSGISYYTKQEIKQRLDNCFFRLSGELTRLTPTLQKMAESSQPVMIVGEYGTGRSECSELYYLQSDYCDKSYIEVDFEILDKKSGDFLLNHHRSPLFNSDHVIHFKNLDLSSNSFIKEFFTTFEHLRVHENNAVIFSFDPRNEFIQKYINYIKDKYQCLELTLTPLRFNMDRIPVIANLFLSQKNATEKNNVLRFDKEAFDLLQSFSWPNNYPQFERVLNQLFILSSDHLIHAADVMNFIQIEETETNQQAPVALNTINIHKPLNQIEKDIIQAVVKEHNGNQSAAAKQLGISRTTLWRIYKDL